MPATENSPVCNACGIVRTLAESLVGIVFKETNTWVYTGVGVFCSNSCLELGLDSGATLISRLTVDIPSRSRSAYIHRAGTEVAPVRKISEDMWLIEIKSISPHGPWYEQLKVRLSDTEIVEIEIRKPR